MSRFLSFLLITTLILSLLLTGCTDTSGDRIHSSENSSLTLSETAQKPEHKEPEEENPSNESDTQSAPDSENGPDTPDGSNASEHTDTDNNGLCDGCGISVTITLDIFAVNDLHGKLCDSSAQSGVDEMTTYLKNAYQNEDHVLILSSGDMWQGSSESNLTKGLVITEWMNELDFVSMTLGNHEFDWGEEYILHNANAAEFPFLAINIFDSETNKLAEYCTPSVMVERGEAQIGIIGAIGNCYSSISGEHSSGFYFKVGKELTDLVNAEAARLREAGADFIIYSIHGTHSGNALNESVDIIFEGHSHKIYVNRDSGGIYHLQGGGDNKGITHAEAVVNFANGKSTVCDAKYLPSSTYDAFPDDPIVNELIEKYEDQLSESNRILGTNDLYRDRDELRQLMSDLYLKVGLEAFGNEYDIVLGGAYFTVRSPGYLEAGDVTLSQIQMLFPFENDLVLCSIKGTDLLNQFINTANSNYFISYSNYGELIKNRINPNTTYYVVTDTYSSSYAPNRLTEIKRYTEGVYPYHLLAQFVKEGGLERSDKFVCTPITEIIEIGSSVPTGKSTSDSYYVQGKVIFIESTTWGNMYIEDEHGNRLYVYGVYDETGRIRYDAMNDPPRSGDIVVLYGKIMNSVNAQNGSIKIQLQNARVISKS